MKYLFFYNYEPHGLKIMARSYLNEGWQLLRLSDTSIAVFMDDQIDEATRETMLKVIHSLLKRTGRHKPVQLDITEIMSRHHERLKEEHFRNLRFHDRFLDEARMLINRTLIP